jgi:hypothetical protein
MNYDLAGQETHVYPWIVGERSQVVTAGMTS